MLDIVDAIVLAGVAAPTPRSIPLNEIDLFAEKSGISRDQFDVSVENLRELKLILTPTYIVLTSFGREFLRAVSD